MAQTLKWTEDAADDIVSIAEFISRDSEFYSKAVIQTIMDKISGIPTDPEIGRIVPELGNKQLRERFIYSYRVIYQLTDKVIWIVGIIHGKQMIEPLLQDRLDE